MSDFMKRSLILIAVLLLIPMVSAVDSASYQIVADRTLVEFNFDSVENLELRLPFDAVALESNVQYETEDFESYKILKISSGSNVNIKYITDSFVEKSGSRFFFIARNPGVSGAGISLILPEGAVLDDSENALVVPKADEITSDGRSVILVWNNFSDEEIVVSYEFVGGSRVIVWILAALIAALIVFHFFQARRTREKIEAVKRSFRSEKRSRENVKKERTMNLFGEEKQIVEYLLNRKGRTCWTKEIVRDLGISKVRLSRRLRNLEQKGLIQRTPHGNENRIELKK